MNEPGNPLELATIAELTNELCDRMHAQGGCLILALAWRNEGQGSAGDDRAMQNLSRTVGMSYEVAGLVALMQRQVGRFFDAELDAEAERMAEIEDDEEDEP